MLENLITYSAIVLYSFATAWVVYRLLINVLKAIFIGEKSPYDNNWTKWQMSDIVRNIIVFSFVTVGMIGLGIYLGQ
jgi:sterol desaturase/sphingolipid hydroxylase (fatty acid hydroxylase superfamily)